MSDRSAPAPPSNEALAYRISEVSEWYDTNAAELSELLKKIEYRLNYQTRSDIPEAKAVVTGRVKSKASLISKATKGHAFTPGALKYDDFSSGIEDIVAVRILVPMTQELAKVRTLIENAWKFTPDGALRDHEGDGDRTRPGYRSTHGVLDVSHLEGPVAKVEIQIRTILQHAWAELSHDLLYKPSGQQRDDLERRLHAVAGMLELADREFVEIRSAQAGLEGITGPVNVDGVRKLATSLFTPDDEQDHTDVSWYEILTERLISTLPYQQMSQIQDLLGDTLIRQARELRLTLEADFSWTNPAFMLDVWIRHATGDAASDFNYEYFTAQSGASGGADD